MEVDKSVSEDELHYMVNKFLLFNAKLNKNLFKKGKKLKELILLFSIIIGSDFYY